MPSFHYKARNRRGEVLKGSIVADSAEAVAEQLFNSGITPVDINVASPKNDRFSALATHFRSQRVTLDELVMLCRQFHTLMRAGVPIMRAMRGLVETTRNATLTETLQAVSEDLESGRELAAALSRHPDVFSSMFVSMIRVGESTGQLDEAFLQLAEYLEVEKQTRDRIKSALRYPIIVISAITIAMIVINIWVIPTFANVFAQYDTDLPWATLVLITISDVTVHWWRELAVLSMGIAVGVRSWVRTEAGRYQWDRYKLELPLVGGIILRATLGRFARSLSVSMRSGVPLIQALTTVSGAVANAFVAERILSMRTGIEAGETLTRTAFATGLFTPLVLQMIAVGEETGAIDGLLLETAEHYEREVKYDSEKLGDAVEPILIAAIGAMVLVLALGVFLPMWDLAGAVRG